MLAVASTVAGLVIEMIRVSRKRAIVALETIRLAPLWTITGAGARQTAETGRNCL